MTCKRATVTVLVASGKLAAATGSLSDTELESSDHRSYSGSADSEATAPSAQNLPGSLSRCLPDSRLSGYESVVRSCSDSE